MLIIKNLPLRFLYTGLIYLFIGSVIGFLNFFYSNAFKAVHAHIMLSGFVTLTIVGAMYQLIPTITATTLKLKRFAETSFILLNAGVILLVYSFLKDYGMLTLSGIIYFVGVVLFTLSIYFTVFEGLKKNVSISVIFFSISIIYLLVGVAYVFIAKPFLLQVHAHILSAGFIALTTYGGLYELLPMLSLRKLWSNKLAYLTLIISNIALIGIFYGFYKNLNVLLYSGVLFAISFYLLTLNLFITLLKKPETHSGLDISVRLFIIALVFGIIGITVALINAVTFKLTFQHVHLLLLGWVALTIIGAEYHIIPMLTWMEKYADKLGEEDVPMIADLLNTKLTKYVFYVSTLGVVFLLFLPIIGGVMLLSAFLTFVVDMFAVQMR